MERKGPFGERNFVVCFYLLWALLLQAAEGIAQTEGEQWLASHNRYRSLHKSTSLQWSDTLAASALAYAVTCPRGHSSTEYGENIAWATYVQKPEDVVDRWYGEEPEYDYERPGFSSGIGHFTQIVWKETTEVGCACRSGCADGYSDVCVCQYNPPGNYRNRFAENVLPPHTK